MRNPTSKDGFTAVKRFARTLYTGKAGLCREHKLESLCGVCLRSEHPQEEYLDFIVCKTDDDDVFPIIEATCTRCRTEAVVEKASQDHVLRECWGQLQVDRNRVDWEVRQALEQFVDYGEGTLNRIISVAWEKTWLRRFTKLVEYLEQAVASVRYQNREEGYESEDEISDDEDLLCYQEEAGVRQIAMTDYCRGRIIDGNWSMPIDAHYALTNRYSLHVTSAYNPVPYVFPTKPGECHPSRRSIESMAPPTVELAHQLSYCFHNEMRKVIGPALQNLVRKIVLECNRVGAEPSLRASKMDVEDILQGLRDQGVWWDDYDWVARWDEKEKQQRAEQLRRQRHRAQSEESHSSTSELSPDSHETSPVLSTSTLQTTPSPPPIEGGDGVKDASTTNARSPPKMPTILRNVPFVPETAAYMPHHTRELLKLLWREAATPLFHCKCTVCTRAMLEEKNNSAAVAVGEIATTNVPLFETIDAFEENRQTMEEDPELLEAIAFERKLNSHVVPSQRRLVRSASPTLGSRSRKRSSKELDGDATSPSDILDVTFSCASPTSTPEDSPVFPKRAKLEVQDLPDDSHSLIARKRCSEEMECEDKSAPDSSNCTSLKKPKHNDPESTPRALSRQNTGTNLDTVTGHGDLAGSPEPSSNFLTHP